MFFAYAKRPGHCPFFHFGSRGGYLAVLCASVFLIPFQGAAQQSAEVATGARSSPPSDESILQRLPEFSTDYLRDLLGIYARLGNEGMTNALADELRRREPDPSSAAAITIESVLNDGKPPNPEDALENRIDAMMQARQYSEAIAFMEKLKVEKYPQSTFPFEMELGDAYATVGNLDSARAAYQRVAEGDRFPETQKAKAGQSIVTVDKLGEVKVAYDHIKGKQYALALEEADALRRKYPNDHEVDLLYAQALVPNNRHAEALPALEGFKQTHYKGRSYPAQDALAESLLVAGRYEEAKAAYDELAIDPNVLPHVREEAIRESLAISKIRKRSVGAGIEAVRQDEGTGYFSVADAQVPIWSDTMAGVRGWYYNVSLSKSRVIRSSSGSFAGGVAYARHYLGRLNYVEGRVGGGDHGQATWGVSYGRERLHHGGVGYEISVDGNIPATDSLQLVALNGTENRVLVRAEGPLPGRFEFSADAWIRQVNAHGVELGDGWGGFFEFSRPLWENATDTAAVYTAYRADFERFNSRRLNDSEVRRLDFAGPAEAGRFLGDELIEPRYNRHGVYFGYDNQLNQRTYFFTGGGVYFDFADEQWDLQYIAGLEYGLTDSLDLLLEAGYFSEGTAAGNQDSDVVMGLASLRMVY